MEAVVYSTFRNHLKDYMKKVNDELEPLTVVNKNPDEDIVVISKSEWDSLQAVSYTHLFFIDRASVTSLERILFAVVKA